MTIPTPAGTTIILPPGKHLIPMKEISFVIQEQATSKAKWVDRADFSHMSKEFALDKIKFYRHSYPGRKYQIVRRVTTHEDTVVKEL